MLLFEVSRVEVEAMGGGETVRGLLVGLSSVILDRVLRFKQAESEWLQDEQATRNLTVAPSQSLSDADGTRCSDLSRTRGHYPS